MTSHHSEANELDLCRLRLAARASTVVAAYGVGSIAGCRLSVVAVDAVVIAGPPVSAARLQRPVPQPTAAAAVRVGAVNQRRADKHPADVPVPVEGRHSDKVRPGDETRRAVGTGHEARPATGPTATAT